MFKRLINAFRKNTNPTQADEYKKHLLYAYPRNHTYKISKGRVIPKHKLAKRYNKIRMLFPDPLLSLAEVSCAKGFFVFAATSFPTCTRGLGIDANPYDIEVCQWAKNTLKNTRAEFKHLALHELAENIDDFGGPFQTLLVLNAYQYIYFGSDFFPEAYLDHELIFDYLKKICSHRIIFNNRIELADCQNSKSIARAGQRCENYSKEKIFVAASRHFLIMDHGFIGRYPLVSMDVK